MARDDPGPHWPPTTALWQIATQLREATFPTQTAAARHFGLAHTTISRYESYEPSGQGLKPPFDYLAALALRWPEAATNPRRQAHLVGQLDAVRRRFYATAVPAVLREWADLMAAARTAPYLAVPPVSPEPCCNGRTEAEAGLLTWKIRLDACHAAELIARLDHPLAPALLARWLAEITGAQQGPAPLERVVALLRPAELRAAHAAGQGVQLKFRWKQGDVVVTAQLPDAARIHGVIEEPPDGALAPGAWTIRGWTRVEGSCVARIELWVDGTARGVAQYGTARPDAGGDYGYAETGPRLRPGPHQVQVRVVAANGTARFLPAVFTSAERIMVEVPPR